MNKFLSIVAILLVIQSNIQAKDYASSINGNPSSLDSPLADIQWCGDNTENDLRVVLLTTKGSVYSSNDRGATWQKLVDSFTRAGINAKMDLNQNVGIVTTMIASPIDTNEIVFMGNDGINWITTDCGQTIQTLGINLNLKEFIYHPTEKNWMLASSWNSCDEKKGDKDKKKKSTTDCQVTKNLYYSEDKGKNWRVLLKYVVQFSWAHKLNIQLTEVPSSRILYSKEVGNTGHQKIKGWNMKTHLYYTDDFMKNSVMIVNQGNKFLLSENYLFAAQVHNSETQVVKLMVANSNSKDYSFSYVEIPEEIRQHSFTVLDTKEGSVFLNINHLGTNSPMGTIYNSDSTGTRFSLSIEDNIRGADGQCDFESINGVEGIYIANIYSSSKKLKDIKEKFGNKNPDTSDNDIPSENQRKKGNQKVQTSNLTLKDQLATIREEMVTRITFDKGGVWQKIRAPAKDASGNKINCEVNKNCSLHLHSVSSQLNYGPAYSSENSVGLIIATGNTGTFLSHKAGKVNTYLSRDGGLVWEEIRKGSHIYEVADHGSIIVMASDQNATKEIVFSWDEGRTWNTKQVSDTPFMVSNIITEPGNTSDKFLVYGSIDGESDISGLIVLLDFSQLHPRNCQGHDNPESSDSDYEYWSPHNPSEFCLLGREVKYVRRKRDAQCFNSESFERPVSIKKCECTEMDWECDVGFKRSGKDATGPCVLQEGYNVDYSTPNVCKNYYYVTQGYRKVAGNKCDGGVNHAALKVPCPMFGFLSYNNLFYNVFVLAAMIAVLYLSVQNKEVILAFLATQRIDQHFNNAISYLQSIYQNLLPNMANQQQGYVQALQTDEESRKSYSSKNNNQDLHNQFHDDLIEHNEDEETDAFKQQNKSIPVSQKKDSVSKNKSPSQNKNTDKEDDGEEDPFDPRN